MRVLGAEQAHTFAVWLASKGLIPVDVDGDPEILVNLENKDFQCFFQKRIFFLEDSFHKGTLGGYLIPQYRKKKWQIPKYRVENRLNTDTAYFNHIYNRFRILMVASM